MIANKDNSPSLLMIPAAGDSEKAGVEQIEVTGTGDPNEQEETSQLYNSHIDTSRIDETKLMRRVDIWLMPWLTVLYLLCFLDRSSIGNARLYGLENDLRITDTQYNTALTLFFVAYAIFEVPSNVFLKRLRPSIWLSLLVLLWGIVMTVQGLVHNYGGLLGTRWMLGILEGGFYPGVVYYFSCWYKSSEIGTRLAIFHSATTVPQRYVRNHPRSILRFSKLTNTIGWIGAFGGLLSAAISNMEGIGGKAAWAWIFILEGLFTIVLSVASFFIIQDFPITAKFLSEEEKTFIIRRLQADGRYSIVGETFKKKYIWQSLSDWKTWLGMLLLGGTDGAVYAFSLFLPSIINQLGFRATAANLLTVPVYTVAGIVTCAVGYYTDHHGNHGITNVAMSCVGAAGYIILIASRNAALSYIGVYLAACGIYPNLPNTNAWASKNVEGGYKRSVTVAMMVGFANLNGAVTSNVYREQDTPWYTLGHGIILMYIGIAIVCAILFRSLLKRENDRRNRGERDEVIVGVNELREDLLKNGYYPSVEEARREKGDQWSGYRYVL